MPLRALGPFNTETWLTLVVFWQWVLGPFNIETRRRGARGCSVPSKPRRSRLPTNGCSAPSTPKLMTDSKPSTSRSCGECAACCTVLGVPGLKEACTPCQHAKPRGTNRCSIYGKPEKPDVCSTYRCSWLDGLLGTHERPDRLGLILETSEQDGYTIVTAREIRIGAADHLDAQPTLDLLSRWSVVVVMRYASDSRKLLCQKPEIVKKLRPALAKLGLHV